ncbi:MAG: corrinoid protein [Planctomycetes bacterium]|nr:corrinoid protein [Planctomycetota bacterium]MBU1517373.1 corrinoid protein [Planctomycetota bacterium]MBU2458155.1 corrinoid protein [Planctomycetota bacterium]
MADLNALCEAIIKGNQAGALELTKAAINEGLSPADILNNGLVAGMNVIGERFKNNEVYIPEVLIAAYAMKAAMAVLEPKLVEAGVQPLAKAVIGTVKGDLHDIGKNLVAMMLKGAGFDVIDLGVDVSDEKFVQKAKETNAKIVGMSTLLTTTMSSMEKTVKALKAAGLAVKTMIGGAPVTQNYADKIGADGYAADAASAVDLAKSLIN